MKKKADLKEIEVKLGRGGSRRERDKGEVGRKVIGKGSIRGGGGQRGDASYGQELPYT